MAKHVPHPEPIPYAFFAYVVTYPSLSMLVSQREQQMDDENASAGTTGDRLVRVPIEELRQTAPKST